MKRYKVYYKNSVDVLVFRIIQAKTIKDLYVTLDKYDIHQVIAIFELKKDKDGCYCIN